MILYHPFTDVVLRDIGLASAGGSLGAMKYGKFLSQTQSAGSDYIDYKSLKKALKDGTSRPEWRDRLWADVARVDQSLAARELKLLSRVKLVIAEDAATHKGVRLRRPDRTRGDEFLCGELQASEHTLPQGGK